MSKKDRLKQINSTKSYSLIKEEWEKIQTLDLKNRFKAMRTIANDICEFYQDNDISLEQLMFFMDVLKQINKIHDIPRCNRALSKMIAAWLELSGLTDAKVLKKKSGKITTQTSSVAINDVCYIKDVKNAYAHYTEKNILNLINSGKSYVFGTHSDGLYNVQLRIIDSPEPVLSSKELKYALNVTETTVINLSTGTLVLADPGCLETENDRLVVQVEPGNYKVCVYLFHIRSKVESFYIVLCKTDEGSGSKLLKLPECY